MMRVRNGRRSGQMGTTRNDELLYISRDQVLVVKQTGAAVSLCPIQTTSVRY